MVRKSAVAIACEYSECSLLHNYKRVAALDIVEIILAIAIEVRPDDFRKKKRVVGGRLWIKTNTGGDLLRQHSAFAIAQAYMHGVHRSIAGSCDVRIAVVIEITRG